MVATGLVPDLLGVGEFPCLQQIGHEVLNVAHFQMRMQRKKSGPDRFGHSQLLGAKSFPNYVDINVLFGEKVR